MYQGIDLKNFWNEKLETINCYQKSFKISKKYVGAPKM